jgi:hypothetical protein
MSDQPQPIDRDPPHWPQISRLGKSATQPPSLWIAWLASLAVIIAGVGPWATRLRYVSISGTRMDGWRELCS